MQAEIPEHTYACWYPVGSPEYFERRAQISRRGEAVLGVGGDVDGRQLARHICAPAKPVCAVEDLVVEFPSGRRLKVNAVSGISLDAMLGETLSGRRVRVRKSTTGRAIMQLPRHVGFRRVRGHQLTKMSGDPMR